MISIGNMRKVLLFFLALSPLTLMAQISTGYYRLKNAETQRYMSIVDTRADFKVGPSYKNYV